jgi:sulfate/thiosulfate transport system permease protein
MTLLTILKRPSVIPGFSVTLAFTLFYLTLIVLVPLSGLFVRTATLPWHSIQTAIMAPRVMAAYRISFGLSFVAALINTAFGLVVSWVLVRYRIPMKKLFDAMIDLPFALPTAVAGIALSALYAPTGWVGHFFAAAGVKISFTPVGIAIALVFVGIPFVIRTVEPVLQDMDREMEEAAASLGANRWQIFTRIVLPHVMPALLTGFAMAFARGLGEYGSVIFIAGNMPMVSEIVPLVIITKLEQYDYAGAEAIALTMLITSFVLLFVINMLQRWSSERSA